VAENRYLPLTGGIALYNSVRTNVIARVTSLKVLGVTLTDRLSVTAHVDAAGVPRGRRHLRRSGVVGLHDLRRLTAYRCCSASSCSV